LLEPLVVIELIFLEVLNGLFGEITKQKTRQVQTMARNLPGLQEREESIQQVLAEVEFSLGGIDQEDGVVGLDSSA
jgi:hypothetical protein